MVSLRWGVWICSASTLGGTGREWRNGGPRGTANGDPGAAVRRGLLAPQTEFGDDRPVALDVVLADVVEQASAPTDEHQESPPAVMVLLVDLQVLGEVVDAIGQQCDLHLRRARVRIVQAV